jgi:superoxide reductase
MADIKEIFQTADWKQEKHVPIIEVPDSVKKNDVFQIPVGIGKEVAHPNKTEHHIAWVELYFLPKGEKFPYLVGRCEFAAHGASPEGADTSSVYTHHAAVFSMKTGKPGTLMAASFCNIHGLWSSSRELKVE